MTRASRKDPDKDRESDAHARIRDGFLAMALCHELKQPLHSLNLNVELLSKRLGPAGVTPQIAGPLAALGRVVDRINSCLDSFAGRAFPEPPESDRTDLRPILVASIQRAGGQRGIEVKLHCGVLPPIPCVPEQLGLAFDALLDNAVRATAQGGVVMVEGRADTEQIYLDFIDHGFGMQPEDARRAFEIGFTTWGGAGLGLTLAKFITYHHSGGFSVSSKPGLGTTVSLVFPLANDEATD